MIKSLYNRRRAIKGLLQKASPLLIIAGTISFWFGLLVFLWPDLTLSALVWLFAVSAMVQGISYVTAGMIYRKEEYQWWLLLFWGMIYLTAGLFTILFPDVTSVILLMLMGATWFGGGILQIIAAIWLRKEIRNEGWLAIAGIISVISGVYVLGNPERGAMALMWLIALYAGLFGILMVIFGLKIKYWINKYSEDVIE
jgi:uncharacterized membrane protein HdeD (DUF308 family)